jgi:hypothetical protein
MVDRTGAQAYEGCTSSLAETTFVNALCTCNDATVGGYLQTRGFDSTDGPYQTGQASNSGAAVGVDGRYVASVGYTDVGGSMSVSSSDPWQVPGWLEIRGDLRAQGDMTVLGRASIARDAWLGGNFLGIGSLSVGGVLHHQGTVTALPVSAGRDQQEAVLVETPCACAPEDLVPIQPLIDDALHHNDNALVGLDPAALESVLGPRSLVLPCGRFYLTQIAGAGEVQIRVTGQTALFIGGSVALAGNLSAELAPGAELDLFVAQDFQVSGQAVLGSQERPASARIYVGGSGEIRLTGLFVGNLYAPRARVTSVAVSEVWGSLFVGDFSSGGYASFVFDRAILGSGSDCPLPIPPPGSCGKCGWCTGGTACIDGSCRPCQTDLDCCSQSVCQAGSCIALQVL